MNDEYNISQCPVCESQGMSLGTLGNLEWYRCRGCGIDFKIDIQETTNNYN